MGFRLIALAQNLLETGKDTMKIAVSFSTLSGNTAVVAQRLFDYLNENGHNVDLLDHVNTNPDQLKQYDLVFFGSSTYGDGDLNPITEFFFSQADQQTHNCNNTHFAFFSLGDSSYPNFSTSGTLSSEKINSMNGAILEPIKQIDGTPNAEIFQEIQQWSDKIISQLRQNEV